MYATIALGFLALFCVGTLLLPYRFPKRFLQLVGTFAALIGKNTAAVFSPETPREPRTVWWIRFWGAGSAVVFLILSLIRGNLISNQPEALVAVPAIALMSMGISGFVLLTLLAYGTFFQRQQGYDTLSQCGFRSLSVVDLHNPSARFREILASRAFESSAVAVVDLTGYKLLGKGPGPSGGLLYDALEAAAEVPVYLMLYKPDPKKDPESRIASVFQNLLGEMEINQASFSRRLRMTIEAVEALNQERPEGAKIQVRFYSEKPTLQTIIFEHSAIVCPWQPKEDETTLPFLEVERDSAEASFYESCRRHFARLWGARVFARRQAVAQETKHAVETPWKAARPGAAHKESMVVQSTG